MTYKLIIFDLDGTLSPFDGEELYVTQKGRKALRLYTAHRRRESPPMPSDVPINANNGKSAAFCEE